MQGLYSRRQEMREALLVCFTTEDIKDVVTSLIEIATNTKYKPSERIKASQVLLDYTSGKPKQEVDPKDMVEQLIY